MTGVQTCALPILLRSVNRGLLEFNMSGMFVTLLYGVLDPRQREFAYARAGHEPPLLQTPLGPLPAAAHRRGQLLGIFPEPELDEQRVRLAAEGVLLLYTDGAREACDPAGRMFGDDGLRAELAGGRSASADAGAQALCDRLLERVGAHRGPQAQQDDITLLAVRAAAGAFD